MESFKFKKKYGQNFLVDENIAKKIVDIPIKDNSLVIEIGCGDGRLTKYLCSKFDKVIGYEIDLEVKDRLFANLSDSIIQKEVDYLTRFGCSTGFGASSTFFSSAKTTELTEIFTSTTFRPVMFSIAFLTAC